MISIDDRVLVIAAHPDDEILGAGGLMATYPGTCVAIASEGTSAERPSDDGEPYIARLARKRAASLEASKVLRSVIVREGDYLDQQMELKPSLIGWVEDVVRETRPTVVATHAPTDLNADHRVVAEATAVAVRPYARGDVRLLIGFTVDLVQAPWAPPPSLRLYLPLTEAALAGKLAALRCYDREMRDWPHPRSYRAIESLSRVMGSIIGAAAAEPYALTWGVL